MTKETKKAPAATKPGDACPQCDAPLVAPPKNAKNAAAKCASCGYVLTKTTTDDEA